MFTGQFTRLIHTIHAFKFEININDELFWPAVIGAKRALDVEQVLLFQISTQLLWGLELFEYTDTLCLQVYIQYINYIIL